jgi:hypothetical protein
MEFLRYCLTFKEHGFQIREQGVYLIGPAQSVNAPFQ